MRYLRRFCCLLLGFVLFLAGMFKLMDHVGASLVVEEYFKFFHLGFLTPASEVVAVVLAFAETALGIALVTGVWKRAVAWIALGFLSFFTLITLVLLIWNPDMDCGCFGEAIHLTHLQSFIKNLVLLALWARYALPMSRFTPTQKVKYASFSLSICSVAVFAFYSLFALPLQDFTDFKPGASLEDVLLPVSDAEGQYCDSLLMGDNLAVLSVYDPAGLDARDWVRLSDFVSDAAAAGYDPLLLVAGCPEQMEAMIYDPTLLDVCYYADRRTLMTFNRSNGGVCLMDDSQIDAKWSRFRLPSYDRMCALAEVSGTETMLRRTNDQRLQLQAFLLYVSAVMLLL